jgi:hypothetical protein
MIEKWLSQINVNVVISLAGLIISVWIHSNSTKHNLIRDIQARQFDHKREVYGAFIKLVYTFIREGKDGKTVNVQKHIKDIELFLQKFVVWGSKDTMKLLRLFRKQCTENPQLAISTTIFKLLHAMRKDLGLDKVSNDDFKSLILAEDAIELSNKKAT